MMDTIKMVFDIGLGLAAFRIAWSVDRTQKGILEVQAQQATILTQLTQRITELEFFVRNGLIG